MLTQASKASAWDKSDSELSYEQREYIRNPFEQQVHEQQQGRIEEWRMKTIEPNLKTAKAKDELHIGLDIPKQAAIEVYNWVQEQDWPTGTELEPLEDYHITMLFAQGDGASDHSDDDWIKHDSHAVTAKGLKEFPPSKERDGLHPIVMLMESDTIHEHHNALAEGAVEAGVDPGPYAKDKYVPHMTIGYGPSLPEGLKPPKLTFETAESSVSTPREEDESLTDLLQGSSAGYGCGQIWVNKDEKKVLINVGDGECDVIDPARALAEKEWPDYDIDIDAEIGFPGDGWKLDPLSAAKPTKQEEHKSAWRIARVRPPYEAELLKFADSWQPKDQPPSGLRERAFEPTSPDCTCKDEHKLDCPVHGMNPILPTYEHTFEFPNPASPVGYDYKGDGVRTWMRAETKVASHQLAWLPSSNLPGKGLVAPDGSVHTWPVSAEGSPDHAEYMDSRAPYQLGEGSAHFFNIRPRGGLDTKTHPVPANIINHIFQTVPSLRAGEHTDWHFGADEVDSREFPDTRMMPATDMQQPAQGNPHPEAKGCTCDWDKLKCPVHGMNPDPIQQGYDHSWSIPENFPVNFPQDQPRAYTKAGSVMATGDEASKGSHAEERRESQKGQSNSDEHKLEKVGEGSDHHDSEAHSSTDKNGTTESAYNCSEGDQENGVGIDHEYNVACRCIGCQARREHSWHVQGLGTSDEGWSGLPRAEGAAESPCYTLAHGRCSPRDQNSSSLRHHREIWRQACW
jgi:2'-5' RNA ligase